VIGRALIAQSRVRLARDLGDELSGEPRLADAALAREQDDLARTTPGRAQPVAQQGTLRRPADEVGDPAARRLEPAFGYGDALDHEGLDRLGKALCRLPAEIGQPEQIADQAAGGAGEDDLPGLRQSLQACGEVGGLADHRLLLRRALADQIPDHDKPGGNADAGGKRFGSTGLQARHRRCYFEPRPHRALGVVLVRLRIAEIGQYPVAHVFGDKIVIARDDTGNGVLIGADLLAQFLGVEPRRQRGRADEIAKHHRQLPPLGVTPRCESCGRFCRRSRCICRGRGSAQGGNGIEQPPAVADRGDAQLAQILGGQPAQDRIVDIIVAESRGILLEAQPAQPTSDLDWHCRATPLPVETPLPRAAPSSGKKSNEVAPSHSMT
jgi:hypothetical protein